MRTHVVQKGDTLWKIAKQYGISFDELKRLNGHLANPDYVVPGMEIILPDNASNTGKTATTRTTSYKEKLTEPIGPVTERQTQPVQNVRPSKEELTMPMPELPPQPVQETKPSKEKMTEPLPEYVMPTPPAPQPVPMPQIQPEIMPEFHFAPQMHFTQPQPMPMPQSEKIILTQPQPQPIPMPMPQPQPIMIELPKQEIKVDIDEKEFKTEFIHVPQPYLVYVPHIVEHIKYVPQPQPCPCQHKKHRCHQKHRPCGCGGNQTMPMHMEQMPMHMEQMPMHMEQMPMHMEQMPMHMEQMPMYMEQMPMPCGCNKSAPYNQMMQYPYFEPNYDVAPIMDDYEMVDDGKDSTLPDWLIDSSSNPGVLGVSHNQPKHDMYNDKDADDYHEMNNIEGDYRPSDHVYGQYDMTSPSTQFMPHPSYMPDYSMQEHHQLPYQPMTEHYQMPQHMSGQYNMPDYYMQQPMSYPMMQEPHMMQQHMNYPSQPYYPHPGHNSSNFKPWAY